MDEENGRLITGRLVVIEKICGTLADDLRPLGGDHRHARGVLLALRAAIHNGSLDSLAQAIRPWLRQEVARVDALTEADAFDELSAITAEMALPSEDLDAALDLFDGEG